MSIQAKILSILLSAVFHSRFIKNENMSEDAGRRTKNTVSVYKPPKGYRLVRERCGECAVEGLIPSDVRTDTVIFHIHGGSFKIKLLDFYRRTALRYSRSAGGAPVWSVDYRTMPEHVFPAQLEDTLSAWEHLLSKGIAPENIVVIGDSSGANLTLAMALRLRDSGRPLPKMLVCFSLWGDMTARGESYERNCHTDPFYGIPKRERFEDHEAYFRRRPKYAGDHELTDPYLSPSFADFSGLPPVAFFCGTAEVGESDSDTAFENAQKSGVDAELHKFKGMFHDFQLVPTLPESRKAFRILKQILEK